ncbi:MAG: hypothetical protein KIT36_23840 [Alphaproteobacteria bacterium]|nr:hypothetical protein [Alphaproteobacteria bacterium]
MALSLLLAACGTPQYDREGGNDDKRRRDEALCRAQVNEMMGRERAIASDREATLGSTDQRLGRTQLPQQMRDRDDSNRSSRLMESCMSARGWKVSKRTLF